MSRLKIRHCNRCGHTWTPSSKQYPPRCPNCKSMWWDQPKIFQIDQNDTPPKSEERSHRHLSSTFGVISPGVILIFFAILVLIVIMTWVLVQPPSCNPEHQVELTGFLMGFEKNETRWDVRIDNKSYVFDYFDKGYMEKMLGFNVTILCCLRTSDFKPYSVYSMLNCYITDDCQESDI